MAKKRKSVATRLDEADRTIYSTFCSAANSLSQLYTQAMNQQKITFQAGERHGMEKVYNWILRQQEEGMRVSASDIVAFLQSELDYGGDDSQHQHSQPNTHFTNSTSQGASVLFGQPQSGNGLRTGHVDQAKNSVFSNALSSPIRRSLQPYHMAQGGGGFYPNCVLPSGTGTRNHEANRDASSFGSNDNSFGSNDTSMDIHSDSPPHESY